jgi:hypothetical protein
MSKQNVDTKNSKKFVMLPNARIPNIVLESKIPALASAVKNNQQGIINMIKASIVAKSFPKKSFI